MTLAETLASGEAVEWTAAPARAQEQAEWVTKAAEQEKAEGSRVESGESTLGEMDEGKRGVRVPLCHRVIACSTSDRGGGGGHTRGVGKRTVPRPR